jgi:hypothetical protein
MPVFNVELLVNFSSKDNTLCTGISNTATPRVSSPSALSPASMDLEGRYIACPDWVFKSLSALEINIDAHDRSKNPELGLTSQNPAHHRAEGTVLDPILI